MVNPIALFQSIRLLALSFADALGRWVSWLTFIMMLLMTAVVVLRYVFNFGSIAMQESVIYLHATILMLGMASTLKHDKHVRVDIFYRKFSQKKKDTVNLVGHIVFLIPLCVFMLYMSWRYVTQSWSILEGSQEAGGLPLLFLLKSLLLIMPTLLILQALAEIVGFVSSKLLTNSQRASSQTTGDC